MHHHTMMSKMAYHNLGHVPYRARDGGALLLPSAERDALLANLRVVALRQQLQVRGHAVVAQAQKTRFKLKAPLSSL